ncbi:MAG: CT253 family lipoprotein [Chlamydiia bacterium]
MVFQKLRSSSVSICLLLFGCSQSTLSDQTAFHDDGRKKPIVCLLSVFDSSVADLPWSISEEFTTNIQQNLIKSKQLYLIQDYPLVNYLLSQDHNYKPFQQNLDILNQLPLQSEFVVFLELIRHEFEGENSFVQQKNHLGMAMRVRVIDLRGKAPKIILQELLEKKASIQGSLSFVDFRAHPWGSSSFSLLPIGMAHNEFCDLLAERIQEYILVAKYR